MFGNLLDFMSNFHLGWSNRGSLGAGAPKNSLSPPSVLEFLKIAMHCRHFRSLLVMFLESFVEF